MLRRSPAARCVRVSSRARVRSIPAVIIAAVLLPRQHRDAADSPSRHIPGFDFKAFQLPVAIIFGVTGVSRAGALVTDIQDGYFDRLLLTPIRRLALLLGLMVADVVLVIALTIPVLVLGFVARRALRDRARSACSCSSLIAGAVGPGVHRLPVRDRVEDRQPGRRELQLHPVLPVRVPHDVVRAARQLSAAGSRRSPGGTR